MKFIIIEKLSDSNFYKVLQFDNWFDREHVFYLPTRSDKSFFWLKGTINNKKIVLDGKDDVVLNTLKEMTCLGIFNY